MCYMAGSSTVGVRELRQNLSVYLDRIKQGESLTVTEHRQVVAILRPAGDAGDLVGTLVAQGRADRARRSPARLPQPLRIKLTRPLSRVVDESRDDVV